MSFAKIQSSLQNKLLRLSLNRPSALNALDREMIESLSLSLKKAATNPDVAVVLIDSIVEKGFCAGGDVRQLGHALLQQHSEKILHEVSSYFAAEFALDYLIHVFQKPIVVAVHGITMGGGIGLLAGGSHKVSHLNATFAMPEISIGYFPDVGATWFLRKMPEKLGLFLGITGARFGAGDALKFGLVDFALNDEKFRGLYSRLSSIHWSESSEENREILSEELNDEGAEPAAPIWQEREKLKRLLQSKDLDTFSSELQRISLPLFEPAKENFQNGSPNSRSVIFQQLTQTLPKNLKACFLQEWCVATNLAAYPDFAEGVRALLIDKDRQPKWSSANKDVKSFFELPESFEKNLLSAYL